MSKMSVDIFMTNSNRNEIVFGKPTYLWIYPVIGALGTVPKNLERGLKELEIGRQAESIQTTSEY